MKFLISIVSSLLFSFYLCAQVQSERLTISHLTGDFYIFTTFNDFKGTLVPANGLYLVTDSGVVMIDSPWDTTQFQPLLDSIKLKHKRNVVMCIATHFHEDRTGGLEYYRQKGVKTFTSKRTDDLSRERNEKRAEYLFYGDTTFSVGGYSIQTFYPGPGHAPDNIVIWFDKQKILYGGCLVKSTEAIDLGNLGDANVDEWSNTIKNIQKKFGSPEYVIPGHQAWSSKKSLEHTLKLIRKRR